jgi:hypothetical protein
MDNISSEPFLSGYTYRSLAGQAICDNGDTHYMKSTCNGINPDTVCENELLYVTGNQTKRFFKEIAPKIKSKFSVITAQTDPGVDKSYIELLPDNLITWWSINVHVDHPKIKPVPLGLQNLHWRWDNNVQSSPDTYKKFSTDDKPKNILASFSTTNNITERQRCLYFADQIYTDFRMFRREDRENENYVEEYFKIASEYKFVLCPWGAGIDTHRMWETLYLGSIPITRNHIVYKDFLDYPIVFLDDWADLLKLDFDKLYQEYKVKLKEETRIYLDYWRSKINEGRN